MIVLNVYDSFEHSQMWVCLFNVHEEPWGPVRNPCWEICSEREKWIEQILHQKVSVDRFFLVEICAQRVRCGEIGHRLVYTKKSVGMHSFALVSLQFQFQSICRDKYWNPFKYVSKRSCKYYIDSGYRRISLRCRDGACWETRRRH
jgi:hypothetical protein